MSSLRSTLESVVKLGVSTAATDRLSLFLNRLITGNMNAPALISATAERRGADQILSDFDSLFENNKELLNVNLYEIEMNQKDKYGSRSTAQPWKDIKSSTLETFNKSKISTLPKPLVPEPEKRGHLRSYGLSRVIPLIKNMTNSGLPDMVPKGQVKDKYLDEGFLMKEWSLHFPAIPFVRTQEQLKTRIVWGLAISQIVFEGTLFYPLLVYAKTISWLKALIGPEEVDDFVVQLVSKCNSSGGMLLSIDFSAFDTSVKPELQALAFDYFRTLFQVTETEKFDKIQDNFGRVGLVTPDGIVNGEHGIPSGSAFTNIVGSTVQATIAVDSGLVSEDEFQVLGDDGIYCLPDKDTSDALIRAFESCGLNVNSDKSYVSDVYCVYLQKLYDIHYIDRGVKGGIYPVYRALNRIVHPERFVNFGEFDIRGKDYFSIRTISILENCKYHPMFEMLTEFVLSLDKYNLQFSDDSLTKYVEMTERRDGIVGIMRNQYGEELKGIRDFESYKLIKRLISGGASSSDETE